MFIAIRTVIWNDLVRLRYVKILNWKFKKFSLYNKSQSIWLRSMGSWNVPKIFKVLEANFFSVPWYVTKSNCCISDEEQPEEIQELSLHPEKTKACGIIGEYFLKYDAGKKVIISGYLHRVIITDYFMPEIKDCELGDIWLQQDVATSHKSHWSKNLLNGHFGERNGRLSWKSSTISRVGRQLQVEIFERVIEGIAATTICIHCIWVFWVFFSFALK